MLHSALVHLQSALDLLDRASAPPQIGAQVDLALHQLGALLPDTGDNDRVMSLESFPARH